MGGGAGVEAARAAHGCWQGTAAAGVGPTNPGPARQERSLAVSDGSGGCGDEVGAWRIQRTFRLMRGGEQRAVSAWQSWIQHTNATPRGSKGVLPLSLSDGL